MRARNFLTANKVYELKGGDRSNDLHVLEGVHPDWGPCITSVWVPTDEERQKIADGHNIELTTLGRRTPPLMMTITNVQLVLPEPDEEPNGTG